jgi:hypothetical protein
MLGSAVRGLATQSRAEVQATSACGGEDKPYACVCTSSGVTRTLETGQALQKEMNVFELLTCADEAYMLMACRGNVDAARAVAEARGEDAAVAVETCELRLHHECPVPPTDTGRVEGMSPVYATRSSITVWRTTEPSAVKTVIDEQSGTVVYLNAVPYSSACRSALVFVSCGTMTASSAHEANGRRVQVVAAALSCLIAKEEEHSAYAAEYKATALGGDVVVETALRLWLLMPYGKASAKDPSNGTSTAAHYQGSRDTMSARCMADTVACMWRNAATLATAMQTLLEPALNNEGLLWTDVPGLLMMLTNWAAQSAEDELLGDLLYHIAFLADEADHLLRRADDDAKARTARCTLHAGDGCMVAYARITALAQAGIPFTPMLVARLERQSTVFACTAGRPKRGLYASLAQAFGNVQWQCLTASRCVENLLKAVLEPLCPVSGSAMYSRSFGRANEADMVVEFVHRVALRMPAHVCKAASKLQVVMKHVYSPRGAVPMLLDMCFARAASDRRRHEAFIVAGKALQGVFAYDSIGFVKS